MMRVMNKWPERKIIRIGKGLVEYMKRPDTKWLGGYCAEQGFHRVRLAEFANEYPKFNKYYEEAKQLQEDKLINLVLENNSNANFIMFLLKNISRDLRDTREVDINADIRQGVLHADITKMDRGQLREFIRNMLSKESK